MKNEPIWRLQLWGDLRLRNTHDVPVAIPTGNCQKLLVYLAINQHKPVHRANAAYDLWPESTTRRTILRVVLKDLLRVLEPAGSLLSGKIIEQPNKELLHLSSLIECDHHFVITRIPRWKHSYGEQRKVLAQQILEVTYGKSFVPLLNIDWIDEEREKWEHDLTRIAEENPTRPKQETLNEQELPKPKLPRPLGFPPQSFCVGRDKEINTLLHWWAEPTMRVTCLYGMGGMGKTALAGEFCRLFDAAEPPVYYAYVPMQNKKTIFEMAVAIAEVCRIEVRVAQSERGEQDLVGRAVAHFSPIVVVLDAIQNYLINSSVETEFWQLIARMVAEHPNVKVLCTSRRALLFPECFNVEVMPFRLPQAAPSRFRYHETLNDAQHPAVELYQRTRVAVNAAPGNVSEVMHLCLLLEGVPLAIRIAAQIRSLGPREAAQKFQRKMALPKNHGGDRRHASLQAILGVAWADLSPNARTLAQMLSGFAGYWTWEAFLFVAKAEGGEVEEALEELLAVSWVSLEPAVESLLDNTSGSAFSMLQVVREFIMETASEVGTNRRDQWQRAHANYYHECATRSFDRYHTDPWLVWMRRESANCAVALATFEAFAETDAHTALMAMEFCRTTNALFYLQGNYQEGVERCRRTIALAGKHSEVWGDTLLERRADLLHAEAMFLYQLADFATSWARCEEAQAIRCAKGWTGSEAYTKTEDVKFNILSEQADADVIHSLILNIKQEVLRRQADPTLSKLLPDAWLNLGRCWMALKEYEQAYQAFIQADGFQEQFGKPDATVVRIAILCGILAAANKTNRLSVARTTVEKAIVLFQRGHAEQSAVDTRLLTSLLEYVTELLIHLGQGTLAACLFHTTGRWRKETGKGYSKRALDERTEQEAGVVALIGASGLDEQAISSQGLREVEVLALLSPFPPLNT